MRTAYFEENRERIAELIGDMLGLSRSQQAAAAEKVSETRRSDAPALDGAARKRAEAALAQLYALGYCAHCASASLGELLEERYA
jgi:hypothetical protein